MSSRPLHHNSADDAGDPSREGGHEGDQEGRSDGAKRESVLIPDALLPPQLSQAGVDAAPEQRSDGEFSVAELSAAARGQQVADWLRGLEPRLAPSSLDGLIVAAMHAGHRQGRAAAALAGLGRHQAPRELDLAVAKDLFGQEPHAIEPAPGALDDLVQERVNEPEAGLVKGMAGRLDAVPAPGELESRLKVEFESGLYSKRGGAPSRTGLRAAVAGLAMAAGLLLVARAVSPAVSPPEIATPALAAADGDVLVTASGLSFQVSYVDRTSMNSADRTVLRAMGLPAPGGS